jgi:hypothetical protein
MSWGLRIKVVEGNNIFITHHDFSRNLTFNDLAKDAVGI